MTDAATAGPAQRETFMRAALEAARRGMLAGEPPVGACLVADGEIVATLGNAVIGDLDITAHAEMRVLREACRRLRTLNLAGCSLYVTVEPCLMCLSACHYASIAEVIYGAGIEDMQAVTGNELRGALPPSPGGAGALRIEGGCLAAECRALLTEWSAAHRGGR